MLGVENIPERPCLFIGNHSLFALDGLVLNPLMLVRYGRFLRAMGDKFLFANEGVADYVMKRGATMGHPEVCKALDKKCSNVGQEPRRHHRHVALVEGRARARQQYPRALCQAVCDGVARQKKVNQAGMRSMAPLDMEEMKRSPASHAAKTRAGRCRCSKVSARHCRSQTQR